MASLVLERELENDTGIAGSLFSVGWIALLREQYADAARALEESIRLWQQRPQGYKRHITLAQFYLGWAALGQNDIEQAILLFRENIALCAGWSYQRSIIGCLEGFAAIAAFRRQSETAIRLFGATASLREQLEFSLSPREHELFKRPLAAARSQLGETAFAAAWAAGQNMTLEQAIAEALGEMPNTEDEKVMRKSEES